MDDTLYADLERRMRSHGVNTDKLRRVPQVPEQAGKLGFADPEHP
jgi:apolipoprotein D and lipocalin family protein